MLFLNNDDEIEKKRILKKRKTEEGKREMKLNEIEKSKT